MLRTIFSHQDNSDRDGLGKESTCLHLAAKKGHLAQVKLLVDEAGVVLNAKTSRGVSAKAAAAKASHINVVEFISQTEKERKTQTQSYGPGGVREDLPQWTSTSEDFVGSIDCRNLFLCFFVANLLFNQFASFKIVEH